MELTSKTSIELQLNGGLAGRDSACHRPLIRALERRKQRRLPFACDLNLSVKTVEAHKFNLMRKLDIHNKAQLVQYAIQKKIIKIPNLV